MCTLIPLGLGEGGLHFQEGPLFAHTVCTPTFFNASYLAKFPRVDLGTGYGIKVGKEYNQQANCRRYCITRGQPGSHGNGANEADLRPMVSCYSFNYHSFTYDGLCCGARFLGWSSKYKSTTVLPTLFIVYWAAGEARRSISNSRDSHGDRRKRGEDWENMLRVNVPFIMPQCGFLS